MTTHANRFDSARESQKSYESISRTRYHALAYNLGNFLRTLATPEPMKDWSLSSLKEKLIKIGAKVISHGCTIAFQMAEVAIPRANVPRDFAADCRAAADAAARAGMRRPMVMRSRALDGRTTPRCHRKPDSSDAVTSLQVRMETDRLSTGTQLLSSADNRYHPQQVQRSSGNPGFKAAARLQPKHSPALFESRSSRAPGQSPSC